jgi:hypothetical protein
MAETNTNHAPVAASVNLDYERAKPELLPCPHCGKSAPARIVRASESDDFYGDCEETYAVMCDASSYGGVGPGGCGSSGGYFKDEKDAIAAWNRRTPPAEVSADGMPALRRWSFDSDRTISEAKDGQWVEFKDVAPYAEQIKKLERELGNALRAFIDSENARRIAEQLAERKQVLTINTPEFRSLLSDVGAAYKSGINEVLREHILIAYIDGRSAGTAPNRRDIFAICDAYESGIGHGLQRDGHKSGAIFGNPEHGEAYEIGYAEGEQRATKEK